MALKETYPFVPLVVIIVASNPMLLPWEETNAEAIIDAFYPGSLGGQAIFDVLMGNYNPGGRLPFTVYSDYATLPSLADVAMTTPPGRTYR
jgi:beta-glucosidase